MRTFCYIAINIHFIYLYNYDIMQKVNKKSLTAFLAGVEGIGPSSMVLETTVLPLNDTLKVLIINDDAIYLF